MRCQTWARGAGTTAASVMDVEVGIRVVMVDGFYQLRSCSIVGMEVRNVEEYLFRTSNDEVPNYVEPTGR